ncbi:hypothetical protein OSB04_031081 [Centaurea solstitialis]|uniref:Protein kinase domain-containing protein n=1 Tax=Centaurea solstitialis TaxID=347529 RepID=A0AA38S9N6_9ASTR|nr:hypothetical protein OSB04_031081 [Centaurea solstitialis]
MAKFFNEFQHLKIKLKEIKSATDNFGDNNLIGRGGFGKVYKGTISHSTGQRMAAVKRLDSALGQGNSEFWKEITMLSRFTHENLVSLLGYCDEGGEKILVYEFLSRGSLDRHLSDTALTWMQRLRICVDIARGLSYLHDPKGTQQRVLHRDIKSSNILLDENWNAKVSDLGLSRIGPANQEHTILISNMVGTVGYLDPLYLEMGMLTKESDVYSFGVVLFEVLCGRLCFEYRNSRVQTLVRMWKKSYKEKKLDKIIFQDMLQQMDPSSLETFSNIAYLCLHKSLEGRPMMADVVKELEIALECQRTYEQRIDYERLNDTQECLSRRTEVPSLIYIPKEEPEMLLSEANLLYGQRKAENHANLRERMAVQSAALMFVQSISDASDEGFTVVFNKAREEREKSGRDFFHSISPKVNFTGFDFFHCSTSYQPVIGTAVRGYGLESRNGGDVCGGDGGPGWFWVLFATAVVVMVLFATVVMYVVAMAVSGGSRLCLRRCGGGGS